LAASDGKRAYDLGDATEIGVVILAFIFAMIFLSRIGGDLGSSILFRAQNGVDLLVASVLTVVVLGLFLTRADCILSFKAVGPYIGLALTVGAASYLLALFHLSSWTVWLCLLLGFMALTALTLHALTAKAPGGLVLASGLWIVMVVSAASGLNIVPAQSILAILVLMALAGAFVGVWGIFEVLDHCRSNIDRFGYSASAFSLMMVWLSSSRIVATGIGDGYSSIDLVMAATSAFFGFIGATLLSQRRFVDSQIRKALAQGHDAYQSAEYSEAIKDYDKALVIRPQSKIARTCKADALSQMKEYDEAVKLYDSVLKEDKEYIPAISGKGSTLRQKGELAKSIIYLQKALNMDPDSKVAWNNKGNAFFFLDQLKTAIYCYKKAITLDPKYSGAWYNLAVAYTNTGDFLEADFAFTTATNILEGKRSREDRLLPKTKTGSPAKGKPALGDLFQDRARGLGLELIMGDAEKRVLSFIAYNPGTRSVDISEALTMGEGETKAIIAKLVKTEAVEAKVDGTTRRIYPKEHLPVMIDVFEMEEGTVREHKVRYLTDFQKSLVELVETTPGLTAKDLSERLKVGRQVLDFHLKALTHGKVLDAKRKGGVLRYHLK
jgi:tetratricopeptide (TPR) repeat protein/DNA-binding transcriptional ArsR family regulator